MGGSKDSYIEFTMNILHVLLLISIELLPSELVSILGMAQFLKLCFLALVHSIALATQWT